MVDSAREVLESSDYFTDILVKRSGVHALSCRFSGR